MNVSDRPRHPWPELPVTVVVLAALATIPVLTNAWWTALPFATVLGGVVGGRWVRWYWGLLVGFAAGALSWGIELALLPADPRTRLADVLGPAEGLSGTLILLIGPILFGVVTAVTSTALAGAFRLAFDRPEATTGRPVPPGPMQDR
jgi:hypothetical protein